jgi:hypothetical protein
VISPEKDNSEDRQAVLVHGRVEHPGLSGPNIDLYLSKVEAIKARDWHFPV